MRHTILGFSQQDLLKYDVSMNEVLLLDYIYHAVASPTMLHKIHDGQTYVWISHDKLLTDLPILNIGADRLKRILKHLLDVELISTIKVNNETGKGSRSYYTITANCEQLKYPTDQVLKTTPANTVPSVENNTSYNQLTNNKELNTNTNVLVESEDSFLGSITKEKPKKKNLYSKCVDIIDAFTDDDQIKELLLTYLKFRLEVRDKPMYANQWKGMINKLDSLCNNNAQICIDIIQQSIDRGYLSFFPVSKSSGNRFNDASNDFTHKSAYDEEYAERQREFLEKKKQNGERTEF